MKPKDVTSHLFALPSGAIPPFPLHHLVPHVHTKPILFVQGRQWLELHTLLQKYFYIICMPITRPCLFQSVGPSNNLYIYMYITFSVHSFNYMQNSRMWTNLDSLKASNIYSGRFSVFFSNLLDLYASC